MSVQFDDSNLYKLKPNFLREERKNILLKVCLMFVSETLQFYIAENCIM